MIEDIEYTPKYILGLMEKQVNLYAFTPSEGCFWTPLILNISEEEIILQLKSHIKQTKEEKYTSLMFKNIMNKFFTIKLHPLMFPDGRIWDCGFEAFRGQPNLSEFKRGIFA